MDAEREEDAVHAAVEGVAADVRLVRPRPLDPKGLEEVARDMVRSLFALGCEYWRVTVEETRGVLVADGWHQRPELEERYQPPELVAKPGMAMDLTERDRARLRQIVRKNHRGYFRDVPTDAACDDFINSLGPEVARKLVKAQVDAGTIE